MPKLVPVNFGDDAQKLPIGGEAGVGHDVVPDDVVPDDVASNVSPWKDRVEENGVSDGRVEAKNDGEGVFPEPTKSSGTGTGKHSRESGVKKYDEPGAHSDPDATTISGDGPAKPARGAIATLGNLARLTLTLPSAPQRIGLIVQDDCRGLPPVLMGVASDSPLKGKIPSHIFGRFYIIGVADELRGEAIVTNTTALQVELKARQKEDGVALVEFLFAAGKERKGILFAEGAGSPKFDEVKSLRRSRPVGSGFKQKGQSSLREGSLPNDGVGHQDKTEEEKEKVGAPGTRGSAESARDLRDLAWLTLSLPPAPQSIGLIVQDDCRGLPVLMGVASDSSLKGKIPPHIFGRFYVVGVTDELMGEAIITSTSALGAELKARRKEDRATLVEFAFAKRSSFVTSWKSKDPTKPLNREEGKVKNKRYTDAMVQIGKGTLDADADGAEPMVAEVNESEETPIKMPRRSQWYNEEMEASRARALYALRAAIAQRRSIVWEDTMIIGEEPTLITVSAVRPSKEAKLGFGIAPKGSSVIKITSVDTEGLFAATELRVGMTLKSINGQKFSSFSEGLAMLKGSEGKLTIVASPSRPNKLSGGNMNDPRNLASLGFGSMGPNFGNANGTANSNSDGKGVNKSKNPGIKAIGSAGSGKCGASSGPRANNDKAMEVFKEDRVIARFRTQTVCARYLRATPEAVSYHCSKGGGVCNGLDIKPLSKDRDSGEEMRFGLLDGAAEHRPWVRPQLGPETVPVLREWLLSPEHVDNPYPNQRETEALMQRTGLDKTQLKHWFNNARKRILKPLVKSGRIKLRSRMLSPPEGVPACLLEKKRGGDGGEAPSKEGLLPPKKKRKGDDDGGGGPATKASKTSRESDPPTRAASSSPPSQSGGDRSLSMEERMRMEMQMKSIDLNNGCPLPKLPSLITVTVVRPSKEAKLGLGFSPTGSSVIKVKSIETDSLFAATELRVGMTLRSINGQKCSSYLEGLAMLKVSEGKLTIVASAEEGDGTLLSPTHPHRTAKASAAKDAVGGVEGAAGPLTAETACAITTLPSRSLTNAYGTEIPTDCGLLPHRAPANKNVSNNNKSTALSKRQIETTAATTQLGARIHHCLAKNVMGSEDDRPSQTLDGVRGTPPARTSTVEVAEPVRPLADTAAESEGKVHASSDGRRRTRVGKRGRHRFLI